MVQVTAEGLPAEVEATGNSRWRVRLAAQQLPQRLEVLFSGRVPQQTELPGPLLLAAPWILDLPVETTLWTILPPPARSHVRPLLTHLEATRAELETERQSVADRDARERPAEVAESADGPWLAVPHSATGLQAKWWQRMERQPVLRSRVARRTSRRRPDRLRHR